MLSGHYCSEGQAIYLEEKIIRLVKIKRLKLINSGESIDIFKERQRDRKRMREEEGRARGREEEQIRIQFMHGIFCILSAM